MIYFCGGIVIDVALGFELRLSKTDIAYTYLLLVGLILTYWSVPQLNYISLNN